MPTRWKRIPVAEDPELKEALAEAAPYLPENVPQARLVHDLAVRGARALVEEHREIGKGIEALVAFTTERRDLVDWDVLERIDELAWGE
jgi:hypothetical protein